MRTQNKTIKSNFWKKLFIKICRIFNFEIIDQSNLHLPVINKNSTQNLSKIGIESLVLPMGKIKITRSIKSLDIILRTCSSVNMLSQSKKRVFTSSKSEYSLRTLKSIINSINNNKKIFDHIKLKIIIIDHKSEKKIIEKFRKLLKKQFFKSEIKSLNFEFYKKKIKKINQQGKKVSDNQISNMSNINQSLNLGKNCEDLVYFVEDDYIHEIDSISEIQAIGFSNGANYIRYALHGTETLDIENWIPVYQGQNPVNEWNSYRFPLGDDWLAWYDSLSFINEIHFINDHDNTQSNPGKINFSMVRDITLDLSIAPIVSIDFEQIETRDEQEIQIVSIAFSSTVQDTDSYSFSYFWEFGDGETSQVSDPIHNYVVEDDHDYSVLLIVEDETGQRGWSSTSVNIDQGNGSSPIKMNFVGDIMMGRRFENSDGIISNEGVEALFEPTIDLLGNIADITVANLEIPLTNQETPHPTKGIIFRSAPENVSGLLYAGIDVVSLANNHILDYMEPGMLQTINILNEAGILHSGAGLNSYEAYLPTFKSVKGTTIAFLSSSDRNSDGCLIFFVHDKSEI